MATITIPEDFRIEIPKDVRERMGIRPGEKFEVMTEGDEIYIVRVPKLRELRGLAKGADWTGYREKEDRI